jgi:uncharacterized membrane protein YhaH (DUF805 family)
MRLLRLHPPLMLTSLAMVIFLGFTLAGLVVDDRISLGVPIWLKPMKFAISIAIYTATLGWMISLLTRGKRTAFWLGTVAAVAMLIEMVIIGGQAARGVRSHFNNTTAFDGMLFSIMGATIVVAWLVTLWVAVLLLIQRLSDRPAALAIRFGVFIALAGMAVGFIMVVPTGAQLASGSDIQGAHAVGVEDGGPGLPIVNWSTEAGDLRIGHFVGMHALQALPLLALALALASRRFARLRDELTRTRAVAVAGAAYAGLVVLVTWQALRGQSIVAPDGLTLGGLGLLALVVLAGAAWSLRQQGKPAPRADDHQPATVPSDAACPASRCARSG